jgi:acetyl-CoA C-acetyltransferase
MAIARSGVDADDVDELVFGVNLPGSDRSIARQIQLRAGIPDDRVSYTIDRACCSSLAAVTLARRAINSGDASIVVAGGAENLSRVPYFLEDLRWGTRIGPVTLVDQLVISCPHTGVPRALQAGEEALEFGIGREEQDLWALRSQARFHEANARDMFECEIAPIEVASATGDRIVARHDESPRPATTLEDLNQLPTVYGSPTVTAGNAPGLSTGAAALVLSTSERAASSCPPIARILATAMVSGAPEKVASIPAVAALAALKRAGLDLNQIDLIEINEAFAAVPLVTTLVLANGDLSKAKQLRDKTNVNGGAIAVGHPTGASGARLVMTVAFELRRRGGGIGLVTLCGGVGEGEAVVLRVD